MTWGETTKERKWLSGKLVEGNGVLGVEGLGQETIGGWND